MLTVYVTLHTALLSAAHRLAHQRDERGQASAEYALVLAAAAAVAVAVTAWATKTKKIDALLDGVFEHLLGRVK